MSNRSKRWNSARRACALYAKISTHHFTFIKKIEIICLYIFFCTSFLCLVLFIKIMPSGKTFFLNACLHMSTNSSFFKYFQGQSLSQARLKPISQIQKNHRHFRPLGKFELNFFFKYCVISDIFLKLFCSRLKI